MDDANYKLLKGIIRLEKTIHFGKETSGLLAGEESEKEGRGDFTLKEFDQKLINNREMQKRTNDG